MNNKLLLLIIVLYWLLLAACIPTAPVNFQETITIVPGPIKPSPSNITRTANVSTPSLIPIPSSTPTNTSLPSPTLTWTPKPTLPPDQAQEFALKLFKTNGGCQLPCWIGITPGKTTWEEAYAFLATFADYISSRNNAQSSVHVVHFKFPNTSYRGVSETSATIHIKDGGVNSIMTPQDLSLPDLLSIYGPPSEIRIHAIGYSTMDPVGRFTLVLFYQNKGIMAVYDGTNEKSKIIHICPNQIQGPQQVWLLWSPADNLTFAEAGRQTLLISPYPPPAEEDYISLEKLTNLSVEAFTQRYKDPKNQSVCMEMQAPDWP